MQAIRTNTLATGLAMFSMFFGAGNVVFPLALGQYAQNHTIYAMLGLLITAVGVPFMGLIAMTLFNGDYKKFFDRIGVVPGFLVTLFIMGLIGPFGAIPRCITLSYSTIKIFTPAISLELFSGLSCALIFALTVRKNNLLNLLGYYLTPLLIGSLSFIIIKGIWFSEWTPTVDRDHLEMFWQGVKEGYQTMDLLGAFFFSSIVLACLEKDVDLTQHKSMRPLIFQALKASLIGASLLSLSYLGFSFLATAQNAHLEGIGKDELAGTIAIHVLGPYAGIIVCFTVALACLTTAMALAAVFAEFLQQKVTYNKINYPLSLLITLFITFWVSTLNFTGIAAFLAPILQICYPALIVLSVLNILFKLYHFKPVKIPVFLTFALSLVAYWAETTSS